METRTLTSTLDRFTRFAAVEGFTLTFDGETHPADAVADFGEGGVGLAFELIETTDRRRSIGIAHISADGGTVRLLGARRRARREGRFDGLARRLRADGLAAVDFEQPDVQ